MNWKFYIPIIGAYNVYKSIENKTISDLDFNCTALWHGIILGICMHILISSLIN
jgi:hypothetical protein